MASVYDLSVKQILDIKQRVEKGEYQHLLAAEYNINQGRVNEIAKGKRFAMITMPHRYVRRTAKVEGIRNGLPMFG